MPTCKLDSGLLAKRRLLVLSCLLSVLSCIFLVTKFGASTELAGCVSQFYKPPIHVESILAGVSSDKAAPLLLNGAATPAFRDNLRPDVRYITTWAHSGWTNQVIIAMNLIYLALITERVPILVRFKPHHVGPSGGDIDFGDVFDVPRLQKELGKPVLEWRQVKDPDSQIWDDIGCWSVDHGILDAPEGYVYPADYLNVDVSYTATPGWVGLHPGKDDNHALFWGLAALGFPEIRASNLGNPEPTAYNNVSLPPNEQLLCFDNLYFICAQSVSFFYFQFGNICTGPPNSRPYPTPYLRQTLDIGSHAAIPDYISVHVRRGDFRYWCGDVPTQECFAPLSAYARRVDEVKAEILEHRGITVDHVIMTSDEQDNDWWTAVHNLGWKRTDHSKTIELYGILSSSMRFSNPKE
ncbi:hypothetical protein C8J57DRAFT_1500714 [Mycena rebaudengoi]|nr:hypothetical protein C8J57DRAFT_1500714 [Mycena rebaudengoi]